jgi:hypothetical protein
MAREAFDGLDVDYRVVADIGPEADSALETAQWEGCDHLFISGRQRSPAGKLLSRDATQSLMLRFDGPVTVLLGDEDENEDNTASKQKANPPA